VKGLGRWESDNQPWIVLRVVVFFLRFGGGWWGKNKNTPHRTRPPRSTKQKRALRTAEKMEFHHRPCALCTRPGSDLLSLNFEFLCSSTRRAAAQKMKNGKKKTRAHQIKPHFPQQDVS
jgi:hypothetical protein